MAQTEARQGRGAGNGGKAYTESKVWETLEAEKDSKFIEVKSANGKTTFRRRKEGE